MDKKTMDKIVLHCRSCDHWWEILFKDLKHNTRCPKCGSAKVYGDEKKDK